MAEYDWNEDKNEQLKQTRNICFEDIVDAIENGKLLEIAPNKPKYPHQQVLFVLIDNYVFKVPFVIDRQNRQFLKTIIPSRKATKLWLSIQKK